MDLVELYKLSAEVFDTERFARFLMPREDCVQEAVIKCWKVMGRYDPEKGTERNFFIAVAHNELRRLRRAWVRRPRPMSMTMDDGAQMEVSENLRVGRHKPPLVKRLVSKRDIVALHKQGMHSAQIARVLDVWESSVCRVLQKENLVPHSFTRHLLDHDEIVEMGRKGLDATQIALRVGCHVNSVRKILGAAGLIGLRKELAKRQALELARTTNKTFNEIAAVVGFSATSIKNWVRKAGIERDPML